jgi:hypothetical protein
MNAVKHIVELVVIGIVIFAVIACVNYSKDTYYPVNNRVLAAEIKLKASDLTLEVRDAIADAYATLNDLLGWERKIDFYNGADVEELRRIVTSIDNIARLPSDTALHTDLYNVRDLLYIGIRRDDEQALLYAFRIITDLDTAFNDHFTLKVWNYSLAGNGNGKHVDKIESYIRRATD